MKLLASYCPVKGEDEVRITSRFSAAQVYVARKVKSSGRFGKRRWLIDVAEIRTVETESKLGEKPQS